MMLIIQNVRALDPKSGLDTALDIVCANGKIIEMKKGAAKDFAAAKAAAAAGFGQAREGVTVINGAGLCAAPGLIDVHVHFRDPGLTYKEDIQTGAAAAAAGGFTTVVCMANTKPPVDNVETLEYVIAEGKKAPINILTCAAITVGMQGRELTDMETLKAHGAAGFTDDGIPLMNAALVRQAMETARRLNVPLSFHEEDPSLIQTPGVNCGEVSRRLGLGGAQAAAEDVLVARDCMLAARTGAAIDIQHISSALSVKMVEAAKKLGANVTAEATPHHFSLDETAVLEHGTLAKMNPPLRTAADRAEIIRGLREGVIDLIATDHAPHSAEEKSRPFAKAPSGIIGLETSLALGITNLVRTGELTLLSLLEKMTINPARLYHLENTRGWIGAGAAADLVLFDPDETWTVTGFRSKSANSPFIGQTLTGRVHCTICGGKVAFTLETDGR